MPKLEKKNSDPDANDGTVSAGGRSCRNENTGLFTSMFAQQDHTVSSCTFLGRTAKEWRFGSRQMLDEFSTDFSLCRRQSPLSSPNIFKRFEAWNKRFRLHGADCTFIKSVDVCGSYLTQARPTAAYYVPGDVMKLQAQKLSLRGNCLVRGMDCLASCNGIFPSAKVWNPLPLPTRMLVVWGDRPAVGGP